MHWYQNIFILFQFLLKIPHQGKILFHYLYILKIGTNTAAAVVAADFESTPFFSFTQLILENIIAYKNVKTCIFINKYMIHIHIPKLLRLTSLIMISLHRCNLYATYTFFKHFSFWLRYFMLSSSSPTVKFSPNILYILRM